MIEDLCTLYPNWTSRHVHWSNFSNRNKVEEETDKAYVQHEPESFDSRSTSTFLDSVSIHLHVCHTSLVK